MNYGRGKQWDRVKSAQFDVLIIGGGVSGACLFHHLSDAGYRTLLIDKSDFASATSQASAMMIWGGLLYLKHFKLGTVWRLCGSRNDLLDEKSEWVKPQAFRYLVSSDRPGRALLIKSGLFSYWLMGRCRGERPRRDRDFRAIDFLQESQLADSFVYQEAMLDRSPCDRATYVTGHHAGAAGTLIWMAAIQGLAGRQFDGFRRVAPSLARTPQ